MHTERKIYNTLIWIAAIICLLLGLYIAIDSVANFFSTNNYLFAPLGDEGTDAAKTVYPILTGKEGFAHVLEPFADHRVVLGRLQEMFDYVYFNGLQVIQPYRLSLLLTLNVFLFSFFIIIKNEALTKPLKILLTGVCFAVVFTTLSSNNYDSTMMVTWPYVLVFGLLAFIFTQKYCETLSLSPNSKRAYLYMILVYLFVTAAILTFNIGLFLWPVIYVMLLKQNSFKRHWYLWALSLLSYVLYFHNWIPTQGQIGASLFWKHPGQVFAYMSRILSLPFMPAAQTQASLATYLIAIAMLSFSAIFLINLLRKKQWTMSEGVLFGYFAFSVAALFIISTMRFWMTGEAASIGGRFTTTTFNMIICLLVGFFSVTISAENERRFVQAAFAMGVMVWLGAFHLPNMHVVTRPYSLSVSNQFLISEAIGIPIDQRLAQPKDKPIIYDLGMLTYLHTVQQQNNKGIYTFWPTQVINQSIKSLNYTDVNCGEEVAITSSQDKDYPNPSLYMTVDGQIKQLTADWYVLFTNSQEKIIGFALPFSHYSPLIYKLQHPKESTLFWVGAVNTLQLADDKTSIAWAANKKTNSICKLGSLKV